MPAFTGPFSSDRCSRRSPLTCSSLAFVLIRSTKPCKPGRLSGRYGKVCAHFQPAKFLPAISEATEFVKPTMGYRRIGFRPLRHRDPLASLPPRLDNRLYVVPMLADCTTFERGLPFALVFPSPRLP